MTKRHIQFEGINLERQKIIVLEYVTEKLEEHFAIKPDGAISLHAQFMSDEIVFRVVQAVYGHKVHAQEVRYPADWQQAFKERWCPVWIKKLWPVKYHIERLEAWEFYPKVALPDQEHAVVIRKADLGIEGEGEEWEQ